MSLRLQDVAPIPEETQRVARAAFPKGNLYLQMRDELNTVYDDSMFTALSPARGQPTLPPWRLALVTIMQFAEGLSDRQAADAVRGRIDWKYALGLELMDAGFNHTVLSEFRTRLVNGKAERLLLDTMLSRLCDVGLLKARGRQRTDSTHVLAAVRNLNRLERIGETLRAALNEIAVMEPLWLQALAPSEWYARYGRRVENFRFPKTDAARQELALVMGADGQQLLQAIDNAVEQPLLQELPAVQILRQVLTEHFIEEDGQWRWREAKEMPASATMIASPYDPEARYSMKRETAWVGYKAHFTETCDAEMPQVVTNVETTPATTPDDHMVQVVHESLKARGLLPAEHLVDKGYTDAQVLVDSQRDYGVTIVGEVADDPSWQARSGEGYDKSEFHVDWDRQVVTCPAGKQSMSWLPNAYEKYGVIFDVRFSRKDCSPCSRRAHCTKAKCEPRIIGLHTGPCASRGAASCAQTSGDRRVQICLCCSCRYRRNP